MSSLRSSRSFCIIPHCQRSKGHETLVESLRMMRWGESSRMEYRAWRTGVFGNLAEARRLVVHAGESRLHAAGCSAARRAANPRAIARPAVAR